LTKIFIFKAYDVNPDISAPHDYLLSIADRRARHGLCSVLHDNVLLVILMDNTL
jgi:hypothetical protein